MDDAERLEIEEHLKRQIEAYHEAAILFTAVSARIPDLLNLGGRTPEMLASELDMQPKPLRRFLRGLVTMRLCEELEDGRFVLTPAGEALVPDSDSSLREKALVVLGQYWQPWLDLQHCLKTGEPSFPKAFGMPVAAWRAANVEDSAAFQNYLAKEEAGDALPGGADVHLLKGVLQQHDDAEARTILQNCRKTMKLGKRLIVCERLMPENATDDPAAIMLDLHMMAITGGKARTKSEMETLIAEAGLTVVESKKTDDGLTVIDTRRR
ncbi:MAG: methyltransferase [Alphaproteobacteria bacterium]